MGVILVTGSMPFAGLPDSPSSLLLPEVAGMEIGGHIVVTEETRVSLAEVPGNIRRLIGLHKPVAFVALGLSPGECTLRCETTAINRVDFDVADNFGVRPTDGRKLDPNGPPARMASWDAYALIRAVRDKGFPARISHHAGTHLCNATLYSALAAMEDEGLPGPAGFLHFPYLPHQIVRFLDEGPAGGDTAPLTPRALPSMSFADQRAALIVLLETLAFHASGA